MSRMDVDGLSPSGLVTQYVIECMGTGHFLPYEDNQLIETWIKAAPTLDDLLLILSELLPPYFSSQGKKRPPPRSLKGIHAKVLKGLREQTMRKT